MDRLETPPNIHAGWPQDCVHISVVYFCDVLQLASNLPMELLGGGGVWRGVGLVGVAFKSCQMKQTKYN